MWITNYWKELQMKQRPTFRSFGFVVVFKVYNYEILFCDTCNLTVKLMILIFHKCKMKIPVINVESVWNFIPFSRLVLSYWLEILTSFVPILSSSLNHTIQEIFILPFALHKLSFSFKDNEVSSWIELVDSTFPERKSRRKRREVAYKMILHISRTPSCLLNLFGMWRKMSL